MDCAWSDILFSSSSYSNISTTLTLTDRIYSLTDNQTRPFVVRGFWADADAPTDVFLCGVGESNTSSRTPCLGGRVSSAVNLCKDRRHGRLCALCPDGELPEPDGTCSACNGGVRAAILITTLLVMTVLLYATHRASNRVEGAALCSPRAAHRLALAHRAPSHTRLSHTQNGSHTVAHGGVLSTCDWTPHPCLRPLAATLLVSHAPQSRTS